MGPGLLESVYQNCLARELDVQGVTFQLEHPVPVEYRGLRLECGFRVDLLVENQLIIELKSVDQLSALHQTQLLTYMRLAKIRHGLLINFNVVRLKDGIKRLVQ